MAQPGELVLVLDGNSTVRAQLAQALSRAGYQALEAATLSQARAMARAPIVAVVSSQPVAAAAFSVPAVVVADAAEVIAAVRAAIAKPAPPPPPPPAIAEPSGFFEAQTRLAPAATPEELELIAALKDELAFLREATYFRVLELEPDATALQIAAAFNRFSAQWHPDRLTAGASQEMRAIAGEIYLCGKAAYDVLSDERKRRAYQPRPTFVKRKTIPPGTAEPTVDDVFADIDVDSLTPSSDARIDAAREHLREGRLAEARPLLAQLPGDATATALLHVVAALQSTERQEVLLGEVEQALAADPDCEEALALREQYAEKKASQRQSTLRRILGKEP